MKRSSVAKKVVVLSERRPPLQPCVGRIVAVDEVGAVQVDFPGNRGGPLRALITSSAIAGLELSSRAELVGQRVLLNFDRGEARSPVVVAVVLDVLPPSRAARKSVRARRVTVEADEALELSCGKSSIRLDAEGRLVLKAEEVVSRGVRSNKVKGGTVGIN